MRIAQLLFVGFLVGYVVSLSVTWQPIVPARIPSPRFDAAYAWHSNVGYVFGGATSIKGNVSNELFVYNIQSQEWHRYLPTTSIPAARRDAAAFFDSKNNRFVFSGGLTSSKFLSSVYSIDTRTLSGGEILYEGDSLERAGHSIVYSNPFFISFGGKTKQGCTNDIFIANEAPESLSQFHYNSTLVTPRMWSSTALLSKGYQLLVWGGYDCNQERALNDAWIINLENGAVSPLEQKNTGPSPRSGHQIFVREDYLIVFGGENEKGDGTSDVYVYQFSTKLWTQVSDSKPIKGRLGAVCFLHEATSSKQLEFTVFGGIVGWNQDKQVLNDQYKATIQL